VYRTTRVDGLSVFYREAVPHDAPTLLMLHGLPPSSLASSLEVARWRGCRV
jgi:pimeloyl-ACP methyl ester carboxylesterase